MPFTFSHPAIILPLHYLPRRLFSLTGLIIGSLTPDFEYFIRMRVQSNYSHTLAGIFWFDLPLAIILSFIFHNIVRDQLYNNLPKEIQMRVLVFTQFNWNNYFKQKWAVVLISILIGVISHIFWDSFTHHHGYFVNYIPELKNAVIICGTTIPFLKIAQHLSSFIGAIIIMFAILKLPKNKIPTALISKLYWIYLIIFAILILILRFLNDFSLKAYGNMIVSIIAAVLISSILTPLFINAIRKN